MNEVRERMLRRARLRALLLYWLVLPAAVILSGLALDALFGWHRWPLSTAVLLVAGLLIAAGVLVIQRATADLALLGGGTPAPQDPAKQLVTGGSYAWCRHPMWFGYDLAALGVVLLWRSPAMLLIAFPLFILLQVRFLLFREEPRLERRFGDSYRAYRSRVPLLLPRPPRHRKTT